MDLQMEKIEFMYTESLNADFIQLDTKMWLGDSIQLKFNVLVFLIVHMSKCKSAFAYVCQWSSSWAYKIMDNT